MTKNDEIKKIMDVIEAETNAFWMKDFVAWENCWLHSPQARLMGWWERGGINVTEGWETMRQRMKELMESNPEPNPTATQLRRENINIRMSDTMAWVTFDQYGIDTGELDMDMPGLSHETRILEKENGEWKIVYVCWLLKG